MAKVLCAPYPDPVTGYPPDHARHRIPTVESYPNGPRAPEPQRLDVHPGALVGCVSAELGLRKYLEGAGHDTPRHDITSTRRGSSS